MEDREGGDGWHTHCTLCSKASSKIIFTRV